ncbi:unnamed protein product [Vicia faba]|uniref:Uncharacterized protein n=1 Tax=Vicia faba TaxID=3906 RepID=A0AAV0YZ60_VICFA|nr:unnamed protein product [Vicia faba]
MDVVLFTLIFLVTKFAIPEDYKVLILGWICVAVSVIGFAAPLMIVVRVVKTRIIWFGHGFFKHDVCIYLPNVVGFLLGIIRMVLYAYYSKYGGKNDDKQDQGISIVVVNPLDENDDIIEEVNSQQLQVKKHGLEDENEKQEKNVEAI